MTSEEELEFESKVIRLSECIQSMTRTTLYTEVTSSIKDSKIKELFYNKEVHTSSECIQMKMKMTTKLKSIMTMATSNTKNTFYPLKFGKIVLISLHSESQTDTICKHAISN